MARVARAYIGLGSNLNGPERQILCALRALAATPDMQLKAMSSLYRNPPMGNADQPDYVNAVAVLDTALAPLTLLDRLQAIEAGHGRQRSAERWSARTLDLDLLLYGDQRIEHPRLRVPHPGLPQRSFVLYPLGDIEPGLVIPGLGPLAELIAKCDGSGLQRLGPPPGIPS